MHVYLQVIQVWFQNKRSKDKRDASYREIMRDEPSNQSTPVATPPHYPQSPLIPTSLPATTTSIPSPSVAQGTCIIVYVNEIIQRGKKV